MVYVPTWRVGTDVEARRLRKLTRRVRSARVIEWRLLVERAIRGLKAKHDLQDCVTRVRGYRVVDAERNVRESASVVTLADITSGQRSQNHTRGTSYAFGRPASNGLIW